MYLYTLCENVTGFISSYVRCVTYPTKHGPRTTIFHMLGTIFRIITSYDAITVLPFSVAVLVIIIFITPTQGTRMNTINKHIGFVHLFVASCQF